MTPIEKAAIEMRRAERERLAMDRPQFKWGDRYDASRRADAWRRELRRLVDETLEKQDGAERKHGKHSS